MSGGSHFEPVEASRARVNSDKLSRILMAVLWPSFLMATVASGLIFSVIDPAELVMVDNRIHLSSVGAYTVGFFVFWFLGAIASGLTALLLADGGRR